MNYVKRLIAHMAWADRLVQDALKRTPSIDRKVIDLYAHLLAAEHVWYSRLVGVTPRFAVWPSLTIEECERLGAETAEQLAAYLSGLEPGDLERGVTYKNSAGAQFTSTIEDILLQLCLHGAYHRGQITSALRGAGAIPNPTDYIAIIRGAPAAARVEARSSGVAR